MHFFCNKNKFVIMRIIQVQVCCIPRCNRKYKTKKGLRKHYDTIHKVKDASLKNMSSFFDYCKHHVEEQFRNDSAGEPSSRLDVLDSEYKRMSIIAKKLESRIEKLESSSKKKCVVCWEQECRYAFVPCGHKIVCGTCVISILSGSRKCPICMQRVDDMLQIWDGGISDE